MASGARAPNDSDSLRGTSHEDASKSVVGTDTNSKKLILNLTEEITRLRAQASTDNQLAADKINNLEQENNLLKQKAAMNSDRDEEARLLSIMLAEKDSLIEELKASISPQDLEITATECDARSSSKGLTDTTKYKLQNIDLSNKLVYLQNENKQHREKLSRFQPFMENQMTQLSSLQSVIRAQEERIVDLKARVKEELILHQEIADWRQKVENLELEFSTYKSLHAPVEFSDGTEDSRDLDNGENAKKTTTQLSAQLENLVSLWQINKLADNKSCEPDTQKDEVVLGLQRQVDELLLTCRNQQESSASEVRELTAELESKVESLNALETKYRDAILSVNNTSKALNVNQEEMQSQKLLIDKLVRETQDLRMQRKSVRVSSNASEGDDFVKLTSSDVRQSEEQQESEDLADAYYQMRIRDLEADIYIIKQERDQLNEQVNTLKKKLYFSMNN